MNVAPAVRWIRRAVIFVIGATVCLIGVVLFFTPGPAIVVIPVGLMILATEFAWAKVILKKVKERIEQGRDLGPSRDAAGKIRWNWKLRPLLRRDDPEDQSDVRPPGAPDEKI